MAAARIFSDGTITPSQLLQAVERYANVDIVYNTTAYDKEHATDGRYSGWCTFEQGAAELAVAHVAVAEERASKKKEYALPERIARAQITIMLALCSLTSTAYTASQPHALTAHAVSSHASVPLG